MKIPTKKLKNGFEIPVFGIGTWMMGGDKIRDPNNDDEADIKAIRTAIEMGITHIDTAENYAEGWAEKIVGEAIKKYDRSKLFIVSKVDKSHLHYDDVRRACKSSLERLGINYLDLYLVHSPNLEIPLKGTMKAMDKLKNEGLVKNIGVSNFKKERLIEVSGYSKKKIVVNQVYYNLIIREPERTSLLNYCQNSDVILTAYRPIDKGTLAKKGTKVLDELCKKYDKTPSQIAINWLISQKNVVTISKMRNKKHIIENLGALGWQMEEEDVKKLRVEFPNQQERSDNLPLI